MVSHIGNFLVSQLIASNKFSKLWGDEDLFHAVELWFRFTLGFILENSLLQDTTNFCLNREALHVHGQSVMGLFLWMNGILNRDAYLFLF